jgi:hypothetical protein
LAYVKCYTFKHFAKSRGPFMPISTVSLSV